MALRRSGVRLPLSPPFRFVCKYRGFRVFWSSRMPARNEDCRVIYNTLQHSAGCPHGRKVCVQHEIQANRVGLRQSRPLVLFRATARRRTPKARPPPRPGRKVYPAGRPPAQDGNVAPRRRRKSEKVNQATCSQIRNMI